MRIWVRLPCGPCTLIDTPGIRRKRSLTCGRFSALIRRSSSTVRASAALESSCSLPAVTVMTGSMPADAAAAAAAAENNMTDIRTFPFSDRHHVVSRGGGGNMREPVAPRSEKHTSALQSLNRNLYAFFFLEKKKHPIEL